MWVYLWKYKEEKWTIEMLSNSLPMEGRRPRGAYWDGKGIWTTVQPSIMTSGGPMETGDRKNIFLRYYSPDLFLSNITTKISSNNFK